MPSRTNTVLGALFTVVAVGSAQQGPPGQPGSAPNQVRTELFATLDGRPVTDLAPGDVQLLEDGVAQSIDRFDLVQPRVGEDRLSVVVFVDTLHSSIEELAAFARRARSCARRGTVAARPGGVDALRNSWRLS